MVVLALAGDFVPFAVNVAATEVSETVRPFMPLAEQLGRIFACLNDGLPDKLEVEYQGGLAGAGTAILTLSVLKGLFAAGTEEPVSYVNAPKLAEERGLEVRETSTTTSHDYVNLVTLRSGDHAVAGTLTGPKTEPRLVMVDDHAVEVPPSRHMLVVRNDDRPGMIGMVGTELGAAGVSISSMTVGPSANGTTALMVLSTDRQVPDATFEALKAAGGILDLHRVTASP
jgi:D-3-phosphoglycerate dehydrogenase